jgi:hypothetical protein
MTQPQSQLTAAERVAQINKQLDSLDDDMFTMLRDVNDYAEAHGWGGKIVKRGLDQIHMMERRIEELQEERRQLRAATQTMLAS